MEIIWIDGNDLLSHLNSRELFEAVKSGELTPYDRDDGKKIVDYDTLLVCTETGKGIAQWRMPTEREVDENIPIDSKPSFITRENITGFIYLVHQVESLSEKLKIPSLDDSGAVATSKESIDQGTPEKQPLQEKKTPTNSIHREYENEWLITYLGKSRRFPDYKYIRYLIWILEKRNVGALEIISRISGTYIPEDRTTEGLSINNAHKDWDHSDRCIKNIKRLQAEMQEETDPLVRRESKSEYDKEIKKLIAKRNAGTQKFDRPHDKKAQQNVTKGLNRAYNALKNKGLTDMAKHLRKEIKPDGDYGFIYTATDKEWDIKQ